jgi:hypothetical protein
MPRPHDWYPDTDPKALEVFIELQRKMTPGEKIEAVFQMSEKVRQITEAHERKLRPTACDREIFLRVAAHHLDRGTMLGAYGWIPNDVRLVEVVAEKNFVVRHTDGKTEIVHALHAIEDNEPNGYVALVDSDGMMKALFHKPTIDSWEEPTEA